MRGEVDHYETEKRYVRADGQVIWIALTSSTVRDTAGRFAYGVRMAQDITERVEGDQQKRLLLNELNHRVKNTLSTVQALVAQTARSCTTAAEFRERFEPRLLALSIAHDRLTRNDWIGVQLAEIVEEELRVHRAEDRSLTADGPPLILPPKVSLSLSLALHELATNAAKYGSLSRAGGTVHVTWEVDDMDEERRLLLIEWRERGGPAVSQPQASGFGTRLLKVTAAELDGEMDLDYAPAGFHWALRFPLKGS